MLIVDDIVVFLTFYKIGIWKATEKNYHFSKRICKIKLRPPKNFCAAHKGKSTIIMIRLEKCACFKQLCGHYHVKCIVFMGFLHSAWQSAIL